MWIGCWRLVGAYSNKPLIAESVPIGEGIYIRREVGSGQVVGAFIRGYSRFLRKMKQRKPISLRKAKTLRLEDEARAIIAWQCELLGLSRKTEVGDLRRQQALLQALLSI